MYKVGDKIRAMGKLCDCGGGGLKEVSGSILQVIEATNGIWYKLDTSSGIVTVSEENILGDVE